MGSALDTVNHFYALSNQQAAGLPAMRALITDDITLEGPLNRTSGAEAYVAVLEQLLPAHVEYRIHRQFEEDDQVCSIYDLLLTAPSGVWQRFVLFGATDHNDRIFGSSRDTHQNRQ